MSLLLGTYVEWRVLGYSTQNSMICVFLLGHPAKPLKVRIVLVLLRCLPIPEGSVKNCSSPLWLLMHYAYRAVLQWFCRRTPYFFRIICIWLGPLSLYSFLREWPSMNSRLIQYFVLFCFVLPKWSPLGVESRAGRFFLYYQPLEYLSLSHCLSSPPSYSAVKCVNCIFF